MQSREYPEEITFACNNGKQMWTRSLVEVRWFLSHEEAELAMAATKAACAHQAWVKTSDWLLLEDFKVKERLAVLQPTA